MATTFKSEQSKAARPAPSISQAGQGVTLRGHFALSAAAVVNDVWQLVKWPANTVIDDMVFDFDTVDSHATPTAVMQVGILNSALTALLGPVFIASTGAQSKAGGMLRPTDFDVYRSQPRDYDRYLGVLMQTVPATAVAPTAVTTNLGKWAASTAYASGDYITLDSGQIMKCTTAGTSSTAAPDWDTANAATTTDGTVTWTAASSVLGLSVRFRNANFGS